jgi:hypothetical protein
MNSYEESTAEEPEWRKDICLGLRAGRSFSGTARVRGIPLQSAYCAGFMDSLRCELIHDRSHVRVTMLEMPAIKSQQTNEPEDSCPTL